MNDLYPCHLKLVIPCSSRKVSSNILHHDDERNKTLRKMRNFAGLVPALFYLLWFSSCYEAEATAKDKVIALSEAAEVVDVEDVFEDTFSQAEDQRREKLKSLGFHVRVSFDSFHQFLDRESREPPPQGNYKDRWSKRSFFYTF